MKKSGLLFIALSLAALLLSGCYYAPPTSRTVHTYSTSTQTVQTSTYYGDAYPYY
ncbi:MAG: hypothetical protein WGN25_12135 [Candidatus Electrothrix sp. GW3-4]|uniref:hypothetical protein n=1 Tax=Candidatus Electrothrix sp. GW3-4 TaxID=3126740 RepID=UPI0030CAB7C1